MDWKGERCVVTEHVPGRNFAEAIASGRRLGFQQVHTLGRIAAQVLALLHEKGLVHGSIQPSNIMVANGVIKIADLGLGRLAHAHAHGRLLPRAGGRPHARRRRLRARRCHLPPADRRPPALAAAGRRAAAAVAARAGRARGHGQAAAEDAAPAAGAAVAERRCLPRRAAPDGPHRMSFAGDLHTFDIFDLLAWMAGRRKAGLLSAHAPLDAQDARRSATAPSSGRARTTRARPSARRWCATR